MRGLFVGTPAALTSLRGPPGYPTYLVTSASSTDLAQSKTQLMLSRGTGSKRPREKPVDQGTGSFPPGRTFLAWGSHRGLDLGFVAGVQLRSTGPRVT